MNSLILFQIFFVTAIDLIVCNPVEEFSKGLELAQLTDKVAVEEKIAEKPDQKKAEIDKGYNNGNNGQYGGNPCRSCPPQQQCTNGYNQIFSAGLQENYAQESDKELLSQLEFLLKCSECMSYNNGQCYSNNNGGANGGGNGGSWSNGGAGAEWGPGDNGGWGNGGASAEWGPGGNGGWGNGGANPEWGPGGNGNRPGNRPGGAYGSNQWNKLEKNKPKELEERVEVVDTTEQAKTNP